MKKLLILVLTLNAAYAKDCDYGKPGQCQANEFCVNVDKDKAECRPQTALERLNLGFPFRSVIKVVCDQGWLSPVGNSHTWWNTAFALDLQSDRQMTDVEVLAGAQGKVIVSDECRTENDQCGMGFGNAVKILAESGHMIFYAHLKRVLVKTGDSVKVGEKIGIEGMTGWTGAGNRHLHLSVHYDWRPNGFEYWKQVGFVPASVPFGLLCGAKELRCLRTTEKFGKVCAQ